MIWLPGKAAGTQTRVGECAVYYSHDVERHKMPIRSNAAGIGWEVMTSARMGAARTNGRIERYWESRPTKMSRINGLRNLLKTKELKAILRIMNAAPQYVTNTAKALEAILFLAEQSPGIDVYHVVKAAFFADKYHLKKYGRPISGDAYDAGPYGPLPRVVYGLLKHDPLEMLALESNGHIPVRVGETYRVEALRSPNHRRLSKTDIEALEHGLKHVEGRSFQSIYTETHDDPAYMNADGGRMDYRDFIPDSDPHKAEKIEAIEETASYAVL